MDAEQQSDTPCKETKRTVLGSLPEALFIAGVTALAYWLAFLYQVSYLQYFDLPPELAEVSLQSILLVVLALLVAMMGIFWSLNLLAVFLSDDPASHRHIFPFTILPLLFATWITYFGFRKSDWFLYLVFSIPAVWVGLHELLLRTRWRRFVLAFRANRPTTLMQGISEMFGPRAYGITAMVILLSALAYITGRGKAATQKAFFYFPDSPEIVAIRIYSDRILAVPFDRGSKTFRPEVIIRKIDQKDIRLTLDENVGPLTRPR